MVTAVKHVLSTEKGMIYAVNMVRAIGSKQLFIAVNGLVATNQGTWGKYPVCIMEHSLVGRNRTDTYHLHENPRKVINDIFMHMPEKAVEEELNRFLRERYVDTFWGRFLRTRMGEVLAARELRLPKEDQ